MNIARISCLVAAVHVATNVCVILGRIWDADAISDQGKDQVRLAAQAKRIQFNFEQPATLQEIPPRYHMSQLQIVNKSYHLVPVVLMAVIQHRQCCLLWEPQDHPMLLITRLNPSHPCLLRAQLQALLTVEHLKTPPLVTL